MHYQPIGFQEDWVSSPSENTRPRTVKRGINNIPVEISDGMLLHFFIDNIHTLDTLLGTALENLYQRICQQLCVCVFFLTF